MFKVAYAKFSVEISHKLLTTTQIIVYTVFTKINYERLVYMTKSIKNIVFAEAWISLENEVLTDEDNGKDFLSIYSLQNDDMRAIADIVIDRFAINKEIVRAITEREIIIEDVAGEIKRPIYNYEKIVEEIDGEKLHFNKFLFKYDKHRKSDFGWEPGVRVYCHYKD